MHIISSLLSSDENHFISTSILSCALAFATVYRHCCYAATTTVHWLFIPPIHHLSTTSGCLEHLYTWLAGRQALAATSKLLSGLKFETTTWHAPLYVYTLLRSLNRQLGTINHPQTCGGKTDVVKARGQASKSLKTLQHFVVYKF